MLRGIYSAASGMIYNQYKEDVSANNIANSTTTGYKQDTVYTEPFPEVKIQDSALPDGNKIIGSLSLGVMPGWTNTDFTEGAVTDTGSSLDFAIEGNGFFSVQFNDGITNSIKYTRDGSFSVDKNGMIVNSSGAFLLGKNLATGRIEPISTGGGKMSVSEDGTVSIDSRAMYTMDINTFADNTSLIKYGKNMYSAASQAIPAKSGQYIVKQGALENSNTDMANEMVNMIVNLRSYQANQRVLQTENETLDKTVNQLAALK